MKKKSKKEPRIAASVSFKVSEYDLIEKKKGDVPVARFIRDIVMDKLGYVED